MLSGVDQLTKAMCVAEGKKLIEVEYLSPNKQALREQSHKSYSKWCLKKLTLWRLKNIRISSISMNSENVIVMTIEAYSYLSLTFTALPLIFGKKEFDWYWRLRFRMLQISSDLSLHLFKRRIVQYVMLEFLLRSLLQPFHFIDQIWCQ